MALLAPVFLLGLFALALPWALHRLNQQNAPVEDFPSGQFLEPSAPVSFREKQLKYLKLLLLRFSMLALLCLLFAQPVFKRLGAYAEDSNALHLIVIDQSFSMQHGSRWQDAVKKVESVLSTIPDSATVQLMGLESSLIVITEPATDKAQIGTALHSLKPGLSAFSYSAAMRWFDAYAEQQTLPVSVYLITDIQATAMPLRLNELHAQHLNALQVFQVGAASSSNRSIRALAEPQNEEFFDIQAQISAFGEEVNSQDVKVRLEKEGALIAVESVTLDAQGQGQVKFASLEWPAANRLASYKISLDKPDALPEDDYALVPVRPMPFSHVRITDEGYIGRTQSRVEVIYAKTALGLDKRNKVFISRLTSSGIAGDTDVLLYIDDNIPASEALPKLPATLVEYLSEGGNVLYLLNAEGAERASDISVSGVEASHPINLDLDEWSDVEFYSHRKFVLADTDTALITTTGGYPVLIESARSAGRLLWLNASLNGANNNLPVSPVFVPFMHGVVNYFLRNESFPSQLSVGQSVKLGESVQIIDPAGRQIRNLADTTDTTNEVLHQRGVYTILDRRGEHSLVVSTDPLESDTTAAADSVVSNWQFTAAESGTGVAAADNRESSATAKEEADSGKESGTISIVKWLLPAAVFLLLLESIYANYHLQIRRSV